MPSVAPRLPRLPEEGAPAGAPSPAPGARARPRARPWRRWLLVLHRDLGFLAVGLTLAYAVSGVAVNHREHWDYNFVVTAEARTVGGPAALLPGLSPEAAARPPGELARVRQADLVERLTDLSGHPAPPHKVFWRAPDRLSLFFGEADADVVDYLPETGRLEGELRRPRALFRQLNFLHLNEPRGAWTWIADGYAAVLVFLALSGALIVRGRKGLLGRGGLYLLLGLALPAVAWVLLGR